MKWVRRPLVPGETDPELLWGSVLGAAALIAAGWLRSGIPTPLCPLHAITGIPCPTCGATRAASSMLHGNLPAALLLNPLMTITLCGAALYLLYAAVVVIGRLPRIRIESLSSTEARAIRVLAIILIAANWIYLIWRWV